MRSLSAAVVIIFCAGSSAVGEVLYDVSFSAPLHAPGSLPAIGGIEAPSSVIAQPVVLSSFGAIASQSVEIRPPTNPSRHNATEGIVFDIDTAAPRYLVEFDVWIEALPLDVSESFSLIARMDAAPNHHNSFAFRGGQNLGFSGSDSDHSFGTVSFSGGLWPLMQVMHVSADIDFDQDFWTVHLDGTEVVAYEFAKDPGAQLTSIEFTLLDTIGNGDSAAQVDNIVISAIPEPSTLALAAFGFLGLAAFGWRPNKTLRRGLALLIVSWATVDTGQVFAEPVYQIAWSRQFGTSLSDSSLGVAADASGSAYVAGVTNGDAFVRKYAGGGGLIWSRQLGTDAVDVARSVSTDGLGGVVVGGTTAGSLAAPLAGNSDAFVSRYDSAGTLLWSRQFGTTFSDGIYAVSADSSGNVFVVGTTGGSLFAPNTGSPDGFVGKFDAAGTLLWSHQFGGDEQELVNGVSVDQQGNIYVSGSNDGVFGGTFDAILRKFDPTGALLWSRQLGTSGRDLGGGVSVDPFGNVYIAGVLNSSVVGPPLVGDAFVAKYDPSGTQLWLQQFGTDGFDGAGAVSADPFGNVYVSAESVDGFNGPGTGGPYVVKFDASGALLWSRLTGRPVLDHGAGISADAFGNVFFTGTTHNSSFYGTYFGQGDAFLVKLAIPEPPSLVLAALACLGLIALGRRGAKREGAVSWHRNFPKDRGPGG